MALCFFRPFAQDACRYRADGLPDPAHLIPKQRIKKELKSLGWSTADITEAIWDRRLTVPACRHHHDAFDGKRLVLIEADYPRQLCDWAKHNGFQFIDPRTGWVAVTSQGGEAA